MAEERIVQLGAEVDTTRTRAGFNEIAQQGENMAGQVTRSGEQAQRAVSNIGAGAGRSAQSVETAQRNIIGSIQRTTAAMQAGTRSSADYFEALAQQRGVDPAVLAPYLAQLRAIEGAQRQGGMSAAAYTAAMRNVPAQITDIVTGLQGGMPIMTIAIQQGGQLRDMFGGIVPAARALSTQLLSMINPYTVAAAAIAAVGVAYYQGSKEGDAFSRSLALTGNAAGVTTGQLANMAKEMSRVGGSQGTAAAALAALAATGRVGAENMQYFATATVKAQQGIGAAIADTAQDFEDLGKAPLQTIVKLDDKYHFLTASIYSQIKALEDQGRADDAADVAQKAYADALGTRADKVKEHLGVIERAWGGVAAAAKGGWDAMLNVGREDTLEDKLAAVRAKIAKANESGASSLRTRDARADLAGNQILERLLVGQIKLVKEEADAEAAANKQRELAVEWTKQVNSNLSRQDKLRDELTANANRGKAAGATEKQIADQAALIRKNYADIYNDGIDSQIEAVKRRGDVEDTVARRSLELLTANRAAGLISEEAYTKGVAEFELAAFAKRKQQLQQELALTTGKQNSLKDQARLRGEIAKQDELATSRQLQLANDLNTLQANGENRVNKDLKESELQRAAMLASLELEYQMYGKSADARNLAMVSLKSEAELQKKIADAIAAKKPLSDDAIARLRAEKDALDEVNKSAMAQTKALGYASQLSDENKRFKAESLPDPKARAEALLEIDAKTWRERIALAGDGTEAQRKLQTEFDTWYGNQQRKVTSEVDVTRATQLVTIMQAVDDAAREAAQGMADSFGSVGKAIGDLTTSLTGYQKSQAAIAAQLATSIQSANGDPTKIATAQANAARQNAQAQIKSYGDMASAAKGFFSENSKGYKTLQVAEKTYRAFEMAMAVESMVQKLFAVNTVTTATVAGEATKAAAVESGTAAQLAADMAKGTSAAAVGVATQAEGDPYTAFARMAAMAAAMAALGFAVSGGGSSQSVSEQRQASQGTGSVFGDADAKSNSIARALELMSSNSSIELSYTRNMVNSLRSIDSSLSGLGNLLIRTSGLTGTLSAGSNGAINDAVVELFGHKLLGSAATKFASNISNAIFGGRVTALDTGVTIDKISLGQALVSGVSASQYTDTKKSGGLFHSDKYSTSYTSLGDEADDQFTKVIASISSGVSDAAKLLGLDGEAFTDKLSGFVVDIGKISLKDLSAEEIQSQIEAVFSKLSDDMAQYAVDGLTSFQKVGEGYFETLTRLASDYANLDSILASTGVTFGQTGVASIAARERLIELAGGIDDLASSQSSFNENFLTKAEQLAPVQKYVTDQLAAMGLQSLDTRDKFKEYVVGLANSGALATEAGAQQYTALLALADAFAQTHAATVDLTKTEQEIADERQDLQSQLDEMIKSEAAQLAAQRDAIADVNKALFDQVQAAKAVVSAKDALATAYDTESAAAKTAIEKTKAWATTLQGLNNSLALGSQSILTPEQQYAEARRQFEDTLAKANAGDTTAQGQLSAAEQAFLKASQAINASDSQYAADYARVVAANEDAAKWAAEQADVQQASLDALEAQVKGLVTINDSVLTVAQAIANLQAAMGVATGLGVVFDGSHAGGLESVPRDGYRAILHEDEVVIDAPAAAAMRRYFGGTGPSSGGGNSAALVAEIKNLREEVAQLRKDNADQTSAVIEANYDANKRNADAVNAGAKSATKASAWQKQNQKEAATA